jgi:hypothetical protein
VADKETGMSCNDDHSENQGGVWNFLGTFLTAAAIVILIFSVIEWLMRFDRPDGRYGVFIIKAIGVLLIGLVLYAYARAIIEGTS